MTPQQIEAMKMALDLATMHHTDNGYAALREKVRSASKEALAQPEQIQPSADSNTHQPERHELQAKGEHPAPCARFCEANAFKIVIRNLKATLAQPKQEPMAWLLTDKNINSLQVDSIQRLINRLKHAHHTDIRVRINGHDEWFEADWLKHMVKVTPPQPERHELQAKGEHPAPCARFCEANAFKIVIKNLKAQLAQPEYDYKDLYEKEKRKSAMWLAKYEEVAGPAPKAIPMAQPEQEPVAYTTGHCENHKQKGGCQLHNLQCGWPDCDRKPITAPPQRKKD